MSVNRLERLVTIRISKEELLQGLYFINYLEDLKGEGLLVSNSNKSIYKITEKGKAFLKNKT